MIEDAVTSQQEFVNDIKEAIKGEILPKFNEREDNHLMTCYALMELAVDLSPDGSFIYDALMEVADFYVEKVHGFKPSFEVIDNGPT